jgi:hypothetical protein
MTPLEQKQRNEIGRLTKLVDELKADKAKMKTDLIEQRLAMQSARDANANRDRAAVDSILGGGLLYREKTREQRKGWAA